jgi:tetratricopeptide (TPR) repeat protein
MSRTRFREVSVLLLAGMVACASMVSVRLTAASQAEPGKLSVQERLNRVKTDLFSRTDRVNDAIGELKQILAIDPGSAEGHMLLGMAYRMLGSSDFMGEAVAELRQALALSPDLVPARFYLAHIYLDLGRPARARAELDAALIAVPGNPQFLALIGEAERQLGNPRRSLEMNRQALKIDESFAQARYYLGLALLDLGQRDEGIRELERVVQSGPNVVDAYLSLGSAYLEAGRIDRGLEVLRQGLVIDPSRPDTRIQLARAYRLKHLPDKAEEQLRLVKSAGAPAVTSVFFQQQVESDFYMEQGLVRLQQGRLQAAADAFQKVLDKDPDHGPATSHLAGVRKLLEEGLQKKKAGVKK